MPKKKRFIIVILIMIAGISFYTYKRWRVKEEAPHLFVSGNIEATLVKVSFKIPGKISKLLVDEGYIVKEGDLISNLEDRELIDQKNKVQATLHAAQAQLGELLSGSRPQEIEIAKAEGERTKSELEKAEKFYARAKHLVQGGYVAVKDFDTAKESYEVALAMHKKAIENYALLKEGPRKEEIERARAQAEEAKAALEVAKRQLEYSEVFAPVSGVVLVKSAELGEYVSPGATVVTITDLDHVWLKAYVDETDLGRVNLGQKVRIRTDTFPNKIYEGKISFISSEAEFTPKQVQTQKERVKLVYRIKVDIENLNKELKPGMPADGEILIEESTKSQAPNSK